MAAELLLSRNEFTLNSEELLTFGENGQYVNVTNSVQRHIDYSHRFKVVLADGDCTNSKQSVALKLRVGEGRQADPVRERENGSAAEGMNGVRWLHWRRFT
jgi:hypothetical protein